MVVAHTSSPLWHPDTCVGDGAAALAPLHHFPLSVLKVLDLSFNELRADELQYLSATPSVKQV
jgi:hypothetical protein